MQNYFVRKSKIIAISGVLLLLILLAGWAYSLLFTSVDDHCEKAAFEALMLRPGPIYTSESRPQHLTIYWKSTSTGFDYDKYLKPSEGRDLILSINAMAAPAWDKSHAAELNSVTKGRYDARIKALGQKLKNRKAQTYVLFNPMPELPLNSFPWQMKAPQTYIAAFQHFSKTLKKEAPNAQIIYAAAGYPGSMEYYPGPEFTNGCAIVLNLSAEKDLPAYPTPKNLKDELKRKLHRLRFAQQPCLVLAQNLNLEADELSALRTEVQAAFESLEASKLATNIATPREALPQHFNLGLYDPQAMLLSHPAVNTEHLFMNIKAMGNGPFLKDFAAAVARENQIIVTAEPWGDSLGNANRNVFRDMLAGAYDRDIRKLFSVLSTAEQPVFLRFAHEMEIPIERYGWQSQDPLEYIKAYRYFWNFEGGPPPNVYSVWGPAGDRGSLEWYPGDDMVHFISIAIYGLPDKNIDDHEQQENFEDIFKRKVWRMRFARAPIFITEFGVKGPDSFQRKWLENAAKTLNEHPETAGACYFNLYDNPEVWGEIDTPDWSISEESFEAFVQTLSLD